MSFRLSRIPETKPTTRVDRLFVLRERLLQRRVLRQTHIFLLCGCLSMASLGGAGCARLPDDLPASPALRVPETTATIDRLVDASDTRPTHHQSDAPSEPTEPSAPYEAWWQHFGLHDLNRLIETALIDHPDLAAASARLRKADQAERLASLATKVHYSTEASVAQERLTRYGVFPPPIGGSSFHQTDVTQNLSDDLDWWGKNRALVRAAGNEQQAAYLETEAIRLTVAVTVADSYFACAGIDARLALARQLRQHHQTEYDLHKTRLDLGLDSEQWLLDARAKLALEDDQIHALEYQERALRYRLAAAVGADPDHAEDLPKPSLKAHVPLLPTHLPLGWLAGRPDIAALRKRVEAVANQRDAARAAFYPNLDLRLMVGLETLQWDTLFRAGALSTSFGPALHLPIFNTNTLRAKWGEQDAAYAQAVAEYNRAILEAARQGVDAYARLLSIEQRYEAQQHALEDVQKAHALAQQRQNMGLTSRMEPLEKKGTVLSQRINALETEADRLRAWVGLFKTLGGAPPSEKTGQHD